MLSTVSRAVHLPFTLMRSYDSWMHGHRIEAIKRVFRVCFKAILGVAGVCLVCLATALILFVYYYGLVVALPLLVAPGSAESFFHQVMGSFIVVNILFNYYMAVFTNPGDENSPYFRRAGAVAAA